MVLFLFVIMLLGTDHLQEADRIPWQRPLAIALGVLLIAEITFLLIAQGTGLMVDPAAAADYGSPREIGLVLFNQYLLPFEITSVLLLVGMIGAIVLTRIPGKRGPSRVEDDR
jgi:NADH-quinone oxidoreductase subunit J